MTPGQVSGARSVAVTVVFFFAMAIAIFGQPAIGLLSSFLIDEFDVTRTEIGWVAATASLSGAILSPIFGRLTDSIGGKPALLVLFVTTALGLAAFGLAPGYGFLIGAAALVGLAQASANPATNTLIGELIEPGRRGVVTGIKQSGVQAGFLIGGLSLPGIAIALGWRAAFLMVGGAAVAGLFIAALVIPASPAPHADVSTGDGRDRALPRAIWWLATYAFFMGLSSGSLVTYLPLFAQESLDYHVTTAGFSVAVIGIVAVVSRVAWAHISERSGRFALVLRFLSVLALAAMGALFAAWVLDIRWILWPAVAVIGLSSSAWNAPAMMAVIVLSSGGSPGRASGVVIFGFAIGLAAGPPLFGFLVDSTGDYGVGIVVLAGWFLLAAVVTRLWQRSERARSRQRQPTDAIRA